MIRSFFKLFFYFLVFVVVGAIAAFMIFELADFHRTVKAPVLIGKSISEATGLLKDRGLSLKIEGEDYDSEIPPGHIIRQNVKQSKKVEKGTVIGVFINRKKAGFTIPYFEGMDISDVELTLVNLGMEIGKITKVHSDTVEKNRIITQRPLPGDFSDNKVNLVISLGAYEVSYRCPLFVDMTVDEARRLARTLGLKLIEQDEGRVIVFQKPEAGAVVKKGDSVEVTLGRGWGLWF